MLRPVIDDLEDVRSVADEASAEEPLLLLRPDRIVIQETGSAVVNGGLLAAPCAFCSTETNHDPAAPNLCLAGPVYHPVCSVCGQQYAPGLMALIDLARAANSYYHHDPETKEMRAEELEDAAVAYVNKAVESYVRARYTTPRLKTYPLKNWKPLP